MMHEHTRPVTCFVRAFGPLHWECGGGGGKWCVTLMTSKKAETCQS